MLNNIKRLTFIAISTLKNILWWARKFAQIIIAFCQYNLLLSSIRLCRNEQNTNKKYMRKRGRVKHLTAWKLLQRQLNERREFNYTIQFVAQKCSVAWEGCLPLCQRLYTLRGYGFALFS